jgi:hypothetical protein
MDSPTKDSINTIFLTPGTRVRVLQTAGFHKGARGVVTRVQDDKIWVKRDRSSEPVWYLAYELSLDHSLVEDTLEKAEAELDAAIRAMTSCLQYEWNDEWRPDIEALNQAHIRYRAAKLRKQVGQ